MNCSLRNAIAIFMLAAAAVSRAQDVSKSVSLINGKNTDGWKVVGKGTNEWTFGTAVWDQEHPSRVKVSGPGTDMINTNRTVNLSSIAEFGDCMVEAEFMVGKSTPGNSTDSNSGIKLENIYEIQIFDSYGNPHPGKTDCGAVYSETPPSTNACKKPGEWQTLKIVFHAPRFDAAGKKIANAKFVEVELNGTVVQSNVEIAHGTNVSRKAKEHPTGPIYVQGDHGSVAFRTLKVTPL